MGRSNPRMETKNTSVHVRHVKEDTSWHLMPGKKITLLLYASKYWHFSILLIRTIKFSSQTLHCHSVKHQTLMTSRQARHAKWNQTPYLFCRFYHFWTQQQFSAAFSTFLSSHMRITHRPSKVTATHEQTHTNGGQSWIKIYQLSRAVTQYI